MSYESGNLDTALSAIAGNDPSLIHDLRRAFMESADRQIDLAAKARTEAEWQQALWRIRGLSGSFGVMAMIALAQQAEEARPGDAKAVAALRSALAAIAEG